MSAEAISWAFSQERLDPAQKLVLICLANNCDSDNRVSEETEEEACSLDRICEFAGLDENEVNSALEWLDFHEYIEIHEDCSAYILNAY